MHIRQQTILFSSDSDGESYLGESSEMLNALDFGKEGLRSDLIVLYVCSEKTSFLNAGSRVSQTAIKKQR